MAEAQTTCRLDLTGPDKEIRPGPAAIGGRGPRGRSIGCTNFYLTLDGRPLLVVAGEFQASRNPCRDWERELRKIKSGGVNVVTSYLYWIHHEPRQGKFDFTGDRNIRRFFRLCGKVGLLAIARIGPFVHSECRNGGLPDWLYGMPFEVRSNDRGYVACVRRYFRQLGRQLAGLYFKDGGAIIGIQLDNELGGAAAPWETNPNGPVEWVPKGRQPVAHMETLMSLARRAGMNVPVWCATAWGGVPILEGRMLPLHAGYAYPVWEQTPKCSAYYRFHDGHAQPDVTLPVGYARPADYPFANIEMQGGMQIRYDRRPVVPPESTLAMAVVRTGSGSNFLGYYVYHGGTQPLGPSGATNERLHPARSYEYQAPIGSYGEIRPVYRQLRTLHTFLHAFGQALATMGTVLPDGAEGISPEDAQTPRFCARTRDGSGFLFLNNFQDHCERADQDLTFDLKLPEGPLAVPRQGRLRLGKGVACILPINLDLGGCRLRYATAQPLTVLDDEAGEHYFFFAPPGMASEYCLAAGEARALAGDFQVIGQDDQGIVLAVQPGLERGFGFRARSGKMVRVTTLTWQEALGAVCGPAWGRRRLMVSQAADVVLAGGEVELHSLGQARMDVAVFPAVQGPLNAFGKALRPARLPRGGCRLSVRAPARKVRMAMRDCGGGRYSLRFGKDLLKGLADVLLRIDYEGDAAGAYLDGVLESDNFCNGLPWTVGLRRYAPRIVQKGLCLYFRPLHKGVFKYFVTGAAADVRFEGARHLKVRSVQALPVYGARIVAARGPS